MTKPVLDPALVKDIQARMDKKIRDHEIETLQFWKDRLDKAGAMKPEGIAPLQLEIKKIASMMENRIGALKKQP